MSCDCCDNLRCVPSAVTNLTIGPAGSDGAVVSWALPVQDPGTEALDHLILSVTNSRGVEQLYLTLEADVTEYRFEQEIFIRDDEVYTVTVYSMYDTCSGSTQISGPLRTCKSSEFLAKHINLSDDKTSEFVSEGLAIAIDDSVDVYVGCTGEKSLYLSIPCKEKMKGELYINGVLTAYLKKNETACQMTYTYTPSFAGEEVIWKVFLDVDCEFGTPSVGSCSYGKAEVSLHVFGCTDRNFFNWNPLATHDDGSCVAKVFGCTHKLALNYNAAANIDNGSCIMPVLGCTNSNSTNYNPAANVDNGSCIAKVLGCTDPAALNYNASANVNDGSCVAKVPGCTNPNSLNFNPLANFDNGSCIAKVYGCMDPTATNFMVNANVDNGTCVYRVPGCTDPLAKNYDAAATVDSGNCQYAVCHYGAPTVTIVEGTLIVDEQTEINIFFDASGSMDATLPKLIQMKDTVLKPCLMPFFNGDGSLYDARVRIFGGTYDFFANKVTSRNWTNERAFSGTEQPQGAILQRQGTVGTITKVINLVFQDEANSSYHMSMTSFNAETEAPSTAFKADIAALRSLYQSKAPDYFRSVIFQVNGSQGFASFLAAIENGLGQYTGPYSIKDMASQLKVKYGVSNGSNPEYYANQIVTALNEMGYTIPSC